MISLILIKGDNTVFALLYGEPATTCQNSFHIKEVIRVSK